MRLKIPTILLNSLYEHIEQAAGKAELLAGLLPDDESTNYSIDRLNKSLNVIAANLQSANEKAQKTMEFISQLPLPIVIVDKDLNVQFLNKAGYDITGKKAENCLGEKCSNLFQTANCGTSSCALTKALSIGQAITSETIANLPGGSLPIQCAGAPIKDSNGELTGAAGYIMDISKEKNSIENMIQVATNLAKASEELSKVSHQSGSATNQLGVITQQIAKNAEGQETVINKARSVLNSMTGNIESVTSGNKEQEDMIQQSSALLKEVQQAAENTAKVLGEQLNWPPGLTRQRKPAPEWSKKRSMKSNRLMFPSMNQKRKF